MRSPSHILSWIVKEADLGVRWPLCYPFRPHALPHPEKSFKAPGLLWLLTQHLIKTDSFRDPFIDLYLLFWRSICVLGGRGKMDNFFKEKLSNLELTNDNCIFLQGIFFLFVFKRLTLISLQSKSSSFPSEMYLLSLSWQLIRKAETLSVPVFIIIYFIYFNKHLYIPYSLLWLHYKSPQSLLE